MGNQNISAPTEKSFPWFKLSIGPVVTTLVAIVGSIWIMQSVEDNNTKLHQSSDTLIPLKESILSLQCDITKIKYLTSDCIYNPGPDIKGDLKLLVEKTIPENTNQLFELRKKIPSNCNPSLLNKTCVESIDFAQNSSEVLNRLSNDSSYASDAAIDMVLYIYNDLLLPKFDILNNDFATYLNEIKQKEIESQTAIIASNKHINVIVLISFAVIIACCVAFSVYGFLKLRSLLGH
jgi:hypothetical protein